MWTGIQGLQRSLRPPGRRDEDSPSRGPRHSRGAQAGRLVLSLRWRRVTRDPPRANAGGGGLGDGADSPSSRESEDSACSVGRAAVSHREHGDRRPGLGVVELLRHLAGEEPISRSTRRRRWDGTAWKSNPPPACRVSVLGSGAWKTPLTPQKRRSQSPQETRRRKKASIAEEPRQGVWRLPRLPPRARRAERARRCAGETRRSERRRRGGPDRIRATLSPEIVALVLPARSCFLRGHEHPLVS